MTKKTILLGLLALSFCYMEACQDNRRAKNYNNKTLVDDDGLKFIHDANESGLTEITTANVAIKNSQNPRVINFAKMMITDHTAVGNGLKKLAADKYVSVGDSITPEHQTMIKALAAKQGTEFDKAYMQMMVADHIQAVELFHNSTENTNKALNNFARDNSKKLIMHLDSAKAILTSLK
jgi:putative membrane protein